MLNCTAMCRSMDKKPCDNILDNPAFSKLVDKVTSDQEGGVVMNALSKSNSPMNKFFERSVGAVDRSMHEAATVRALSSYERPCTKPRAISTLIVDSVGLGNYSAPLPGNRHRITGLIQRKSVLQERTTLSQAV